MKFLSIATDRDEILELWNNTGREPFAHPAFLEAFGGGEAGVLSETIGVVSWALPLVLRSLTTSEFGVSGTDATSPYGYGGPFASPAGRSPGQFLGLVSRWAQDEGLCSVFLRLSPGGDFDEGLLAHGGVVRTVSSNVLVDLSRDPAVRWRSYEAKVRKNVRRALEAGCVVERVSPASAMSSFMDIYLETMARRGASDYYYFDEALLRRLADGLGDHLSMFVVRAADNEVVSAEIVLESDRQVYSFLGGTRADAFAQRPNDLLKHFICEEAASRGKSGFLLGGGQAPDDGIFRYKKSFAPAGVIPFQVAQMVGDAACYSAAVRARGRDAVSEHETGYFPLYRAVPR